MRSVPVLFLLLIATAVGTARAESPVVDLFASGDLSQWQVGKSGTGWSISDDGIVQLDQPGSGWLISHKKCKDFQLDFEWKISKDGNSGVIYRSHGRGLEYQILDDQRHIRGRDPITSAGAMYDLVPPTKNKPSKPAGEWNTARIVARGDHVEHWLNGAKILEVELTGKDWDQRLAKSKYGELDKEKFGRVESSIGFQDHGHPVWFRNVRLQEYEPKALASGGGHSKSNAAGIDEPAASTVGSQSTSNSPRPRNGNLPNIILIFTDDISAREFPLYGSSVWSPPDGGDTSDPAFRARTPVLDRLAREGCWFETAWASVVCSPSRAMLMTGRYAHLHKWWTNNDYGMVKDKHGYRRVWRLYESSPHLIGHVAHQAGYATYWAGKTQMKGSEMDKFGFDEGCFTPGEDGGPDNPHTDFKLVQKKGEQHVVNADTGTPVDSYAQTGWYWKPSVVLMNDPSASETFEFWPNTPEAKKEYGLNTYGPDVELDFIFNFMERQSDAGNPFFVYHTTHLGHDAFDWLNPASTSKWPGTPVIHWDGQRYTRSEPNVTGDNGQYDMHGTVTEPGIHHHINYLDYQVWLYLNKLEELGIENDTILIFTSDNGTSGYGKHSSDRQKGTHVPLIIYAPGMTKTGKQAALVDMADMLPAIAELGGVKLPEDYEINGESFVPYLYTDKQTHREWIYAYKGPEQIVRGTHVLKDGWDRWWDVTARPDDLISFPQISDWSQVSAEHRAERDRLQAILPRFDLHASEHDPRSNH